MSRMTRHLLDPSFFVSLFLLLWLIVLQLHGPTLSLPISASFPTSSGLASGATRNFMEGRGGCSGGTSDGGSEEVNGSFVYPVDISVKAFESPIVFESVARSKSEVHSNGIYGVTFDLVKLLKGSAPGLLKRKQLRLQFIVDEAPAAVSGESPSVPNATASGGDSGLLRPRRGRRLTSTQCLPRVNVKTGRKYYVFINKVGNNQFLPMFTPELINRKNTRGIQSILCDGCGQSPLVEATVKQVTIDPKGPRRLRLHCKLRFGNPVPTIKWYKNNQLINFSTNTRYRLRIKRKQSVLIVRNPSEADVGLYRCQVHNSFGSSSDLIRVVRVTSHQKNLGTTASTLWPIQSTTCPYDTYCLNGGTCSYYESISEYVCECPQGYKGSRCSIKEVSTRNGASSGVYIPLCLGNYYPSTYYPCT